MEDDNQSEAAAQICFRLDGMPLAIELAAARVRGLKIEHIAQPLDDCFRLLTGGNPMDILRPLRERIPEHERHSQTSTLFVFGSVVRTYYYR